ncbi:unnamed protein product [Psylliodes chrysocephalus]|uniref:Uncharacterized protein n=1 Tax=Psylliodes chrysocephalus TaxID=3402493 RepID=A0A9P0CYH1_9CUCU|nr:unnamed protein product [Psylliodes chrysocephala]
METDEAVAYPIFSDKGIAVLRIIKKRKPLREKFNREKQKLQMLQRTGAGLSFTTPWPLMSFFEFIMFDHKTPRETSSSVILEKNNIYLHSLIMEAEVVSEPSIDEASLTNLEFDSQINQCNLLNNHQEASATPPVVNLNRSNLEKEQ